MACKCFSTCWTATWLILALASFVVFGTLAEMAPKKTQEWMNEWTTWDIPAFSWGGIAVGICFGMMMLGFIFREALRCARWCWSKMKGWKWEYWFFFFFIPSAAVLFLGLVLEINTMIWIGLAMIAVICFWSLHPKIWACMRAFFCKKKERDIENGDIR